MFTQAGFNPRRRVICHGFIARIGANGAPWMRPSRLVRFESGEYAWDGGRGRISWPEQLFGICSLRWIGSGVPPEKRPRSRLPA